MEAPAFYGSSPVRPRLTVVKDGPGRYSALPHDLLTDARAKHGHIVTYAVLQMHWWQGGECWASHATLAAEAKCSVRQLQRYLNDLVAWGFVASRRRGQGQAQAYSPGQHDTGVALNTTSASPSESNTTPVSEQRDTGVRFNTTPVSHRRRSTEEEPPEEEHSGRSVAAGAAPAPTEADPPIDSKPARKPRRARRDVASESPAPPTIDLTDQSYETAAKWGFDRAAVDFQLERFLSKARAKGWTYADWKAGFRTWLLNEVQYAKRDGRAPSGPKQPASHLTPRPPVSKPANVRGTY